MNGKNIAIGIGVVVLAGGAFLLFGGDRGPNQNEIPEDFFGSGSQAFDSEILVYDPLANSWIPSRELTKNHGIGKPESPCPDYLPPLLLPFPDAVDGEDAFYANLVVPDDVRWLEVRDQVTPANPPGVSENVITGGYLFPVGVPDPPASKSYSNPFFMDFTCNISELISQTLETTVVVTYYKADGSVFTSSNGDLFEFEIPVTMEVYDQSASEYDTDIFTDGFESGDTSAWSNTVP